MSAEALSVIQERMDGITVLCRRFGIVRLRLIGSAIRDDWKSATSDFDFLVDYGPPPDGISALDQLIKFEMELSELLHSRVDTVDSKTPKNPFFLKHALPGAVELYDS